MSYSGFSTKKVETQGHQDSILFAELLEKDIIDTFLFEIISFNTGSKIIDYCVNKLHEYKIPANQSDIYVSTFSENNDTFKIQISKKLELELEIFEYNNPEYFI